MSHFHKTNITFSLICKSWRRGKTKIMTVKRGQLGGRRGRDEEERGGGIRKSSKGLEEWLKG
jgi:hypothetical protein